MALSLTHREAKKLALHPSRPRITQQRYYELQMDDGPDLIGAPSAWSGHSGWTTTQGEGAVIAVIDSGINPTHPSFAAVGPVDGYVHVNPLGSGVYVPGSYCDLTESLVLQ